MNTILNEEMQEIIIDHEIWLNSEVGGVGSRASFSDEDLKYFDFSSRSLSGCTFNRCDLAGADFKRSDLSCSIFIDCDLVGADFYKADLRHSYFKDSKLSRYSLDDAKTEGIRRI